MIEPDLPLLSVRNLKVHFPVRGSEGGVVKAVDDISFDIPSGRTVALVGESGCGKSTTAYAIIGLEPVSSGSIRFEGREIAHLDRQARRALATEIQIVFQDPSAALNPKMTIGDSIEDDCFAITECEGSLIPSRLDRGRCDRRNWLYRLL